MKHTVFFSIPERELKRETADFKVFIDNKLEGTVKISNASIQWVPKDHTHPHKMNWKTFIGAMKKVPKKKP